MFSRYLASLTLVFLIFMGFLLILAWASPLKGEPFLTCGRPALEDNVSRYKVSLDGAPLVESIPIDGKLRYDLDGITEGDHTVKVKACNTLYCSEESTLDFKKKLPAPVSGLSIVQE